MRPKSASAQIVGGEDVRTPGSGVKQIGGGVRCVVAAHGGEIAVCFPYCACVFEVERGHEFTPGQGVEQPALDEGSLSAAVRQVFMQHQQIVAEIEVGFPWIGCIEAPATEMIYNALWHRGYFVTHKL